MDILVEFEHPVGYVTVARLQEHLCILLGRNIDLVIQDAIKQQLRESILKNAIRAA